MHELCDDSVIGPPVLRFLQENLEYPLLDPQKLKVELSRWIVDEKVKLHLRVENLKIKISKKEREHRDLLRSNSSIMAMIRHEKKLAEKFEDWLDRARAGNVQSINVIYEDDACWDDDDDDDNEWIVKKVRVD